MTTTKSEFPTLYSKTGDVRDINTLLVADVLHGSIDYWQERCAKLEAAALQVIEMNRQEAKDRLGYAFVAETWSCVKVLREALADAPLVPAPGVQGGESIIALALSALQANENWHVTYDDDGGYLDSNLHATNRKVIALLTAQPVARTPFVWATFDGEGGYELRLYKDNETYRDDFVARNGSAYADWVQPLYTAAQQTPPAAVGKELTTEQTAWLPFARSLLTMAGELPAAYSADQSRRPPEVIAMTEIEFAKARLAEAARDLLRALEQLKTEIILSDVNPAYIESHFRPSLNAAAIAIAKATGGFPAI